MTQEKAAECRKKLYEFDLEKARVGSGHIGTSLPNKHGNRSPYLLLRPSGLLELVGQPPVSAPDQPPFKSLFELSDRTFGVDRLFSHRPDMQAMTQPTYLTLDATLGRPWQGDAVDEQGGPPIVLVLDDGLFFYSRNAFIAGVAGGAFSLPRPRPPAARDGNVA